MNWNRVLGGIDGCLDAIAGPVDLQATLAEIDACLADLGHGVAIRQTAAVKATEAQIRGLEERLRAVLGIEVDLAHALSVAWDSAAGRGLRSAVRMIEAGSGDMDKILGTFASSFAQHAAAVEPILKKQIGVAYDTERKSVLGPDGKPAKGPDGKPLFSGGRSFEVVDGQAKDWLRGDTMFWIGSAYGRTIGGGVSDVVRELMVTQGLSRREAAIELEKRVGPLISGARPRHYWELVAQSAVTRARSMGAVQSLVEAGATLYELINPLDATTSPICRNLSGRIYRVADAVAIRDRMMAATTPDEARAIAPWVPAASVQGQTSNALAGKGIALPPFHGNCRTTVIIATESPTEVSVAQGPDASTEQRTAWAGFAGGELSNKFRPILDNPMALTGHIDEALTQEQIAEARRAVRDRTEMLGSWDPKETQRRLVFWSGGVRVEVDEAGLIRVVEKMADDAAKLARLEADRKRLATLSMAPRPAPAPKPPVTPKPKKPRAPKVPKPAPFDAKAALFGVDGVAHPIEPGMVAQRPPVGTDPYADKADAWLAKIPTAVQKALRAGGVDVTITGRVTDVLPHLAGVQPRGWPAGMTWADADGVCHNYTQAILATRIPPNARRAEEVLLHEVAHGFDGSLLSAVRARQPGLFPQVMRISHTPEFRQLWQDAIKSGAVGRFEIGRTGGSYFQQPWPDGAEELFAQFFSCVWRGGADRAKALAELPTLASWFESVVSPAAFGP